MGMDIVGRQPSDPVGECFRANVWSWQPIYRLCIELCADLLDEETLFGMGFNSGFGPTTPEICTQMANRFNLWLEHHASGRTLDSDLRVTPAGRFVRDDELAENPDMETLSAYAVDDVHLKAWVAFLRHCGGFAVW